MKRAAIYEFTDFQFVVQQDEKSEPVIDREGLPVMDNGEVRMKVTPQTVLIIVDQEDNSAYKIKFEEKNLPILIDGLVAHLTPAKKRELLNLNGETKEVPKTKRVRNARN